MSKILPVLIFPVLSAVGLTFVWYHAFASGFISKTFFEECANLRNPNRLPSSGYPFVDQGLCLLISLFSALFDQYTYPFLLWLMVALAPIVSFMALEASRVDSGAPLMVRNPTLTGITIQTMSFAFTTPLYWLSIITSGRANMRPSFTSTVSKEHAQAIFLAVLLGLVAPTFYMMHFQTPSTILAWQPFPVFVAIVHGLCIAFTGSSSKSGYSYIRALYILNFLANAYVHLSILLPNINNLQSLEGLFVPSTSLIDLAEPASAHALHLLQWDTYIGIGSTVFATLWFARSAGQFLGLLLWNLVAVPIFGPGAAFAGAALWRESCLHSDVVPRNKKRGKN
ncbi:hypothetical protein D9758_001717 [Tetrapyrgos nigripes]|uniref:Uncharacterized protein n=1 Tax=Tetrapyrgos nigripes TaxID=182062 RepID=A0A8H5LX70_9AGAR|nr:hypothetical protein D9758_001717 [Tetrapyrgos nigripes]